MVEQKLFIHFIQANKRNVSFPVKSVYGKVKTFVNHYNCYIRYLHTVFIGYLRTSHPITDIVSQLRAIWINKLHLTILIHRCLTNGSKLFLTHTLNLLRINLLNNNCLIFIFHSSFLFFFTS